MPSFINFGGVVRGRCCLKKKFMAGRRTKDDHKSSPCHKVTGELIKYWLNPFYIITFNEKNLTWSLK